MELIFGFDMAGRVARLVEASNERLVLVSPYFDPWRHLEEAIHTAVMLRQVKTEIIARGGKDLDKQRSKVEPFLEYGVEAHYLTRLHAKIYLSESEAIVTSLNLLRGSATDSWEVGVVFSKIDDGSDYEKLVAVVADLRQKALNEQAIKEKLKESVSIGVEPSGRSLDPHEGEAGVGAEASTRRSRGSWQNAAASKAGALKSEGRKRKAAKTAGSQATSTAEAEKGHCIACAKSIKPNPSRPFCYSCYKAWVASGSQDTQKFGICLSCGEDKKTTFVKPQCYSCFKASAT